MTARRARAEDAEWMAVSDRDPDVAPWVSGDDATGHRTRIASDKSLILVLEDGSTPVGYALITDLDDPHDNRQIQRLVVAKRGQGYGRMLLDAAVGACFGPLGAHRCWLDALSDNARALALYRAYGFIEEGTRREGYIKDGRYRDLVVLSLLPADCPATAWRTLTLD
ncbi:GNAT family N-acetyltransferase [Rhodovibrio salinarum]|nr:GNAT family N-acetyltransferase [Rhodovibrio salinarum]